MSWRTVIITQQVKLDYKMNYLVVRGKDEKRILLDEIKILVIENTLVSITGYLMQALVQKKIKVIFCDLQHNPVAEIVPYHGSHDSALKVRTQIEWSDSVKMAVWQAIVNEKIRKQSFLLAENKMMTESEMLNVYADEIEGLDDTNREGHAAKVYFNALFGKSFSRSIDCPTNSALNYGYGIILSAFNREISINGYQMQLGLFHNNMFNHFNLGSDLMEPFRIAVDRYVYNNRPNDFGTEEKHELWKIVEMPVMIASNRQTISNAIRIYTKSIFDALNFNDISHIKFYDFVRDE